MTELRDAGVNVNATTNRGSNAAHIATQYGHLDVLRALKDWDVDIHATTNRGSNAVHLAANNGHHNVLAELKSWGREPGR